MHTMGKLLGIGLGVLLIVGILIFLSAFFGEDIASWRSNSTGGGSNSGYVAQQRVPACPGIPADFTLRPGQQQILNPNACQIRWDIAGGCVQVKNRMGDVLATRVCNKQDAANIDNVYAVVAIQGNPRIVRTECAPFARGNLLERCE